jgi:cell division septation protein DedD
MARGSSGLTIGQLFTLSFGFMVASVVIFALGWWVGYDASQQQRQRERQPVRVPVVPLDALVQPATATPAPATTVAPTPTRPLEPSPSPTPVVVVRPATRAPEPTAAAGNWSVQVKATTEALEAVMFARQLRQKGYDAYTVQAPVGGVTWYRVRVGRLADRGAAKALERRLREQEGLEAAYVVNE